MDNLLYITHGFSGLLEAFSPRRESKTCLKTLCRPAYRVLHLPFGQDGEHDSVQRHHRLGHLGSTTLAARTPQAGRFGGKQSPCNKSVGL